MAATGFFYTFTRPRQALPMSMLKYDPIGKDRHHHPPDETRRDETRGGLREVDGRMETEATGRGGIGGVLSQGNARRIISEGPKDRPGQQQQLTPWITVRRKVLFLEQRRK